MKEEEDVMERVEKRERDEERERKKKFFKIVLHKQEEADDADVPKRLSASRGLVTFCVLAVHHVLSGTHSKVHYEACKMVFRIRPPLLFPVQTLLPVVAAIVNFFSTSTSSSSSCLYKPHDRKGRFLQPLKGGRFPEVFLIQSC